MIVRPKPRVGELAFIWRLSILARVAPQIGAVFLFSCGVAWWIGQHPVAFRTWNSAPFTLLGIALSIFLGFRNNACYDRWWEARRQLGGMIGEMRSFARLVTTVAPGDTAERVARQRRAVLGAIGFTYALMAHLRCTSTSVAMPEEVRRYLPAEAIADARNVPDTALRFLGGECVGMLRDGGIDEQLFRALDDRLTAFALVQVACERIKGTPTPFPYTLLLHRTAYAFCYLLPFGLAPMMGYAAPVLCAVVAYAFFGLDALGDELEEPFGMTMNALPLNAMARTVEISLLEALEERDVPEPLQPVDSVLM